MLTLGIILLVFAFVAFTLAIWATGDSERWGLTGVLTVFGGFITTMLATIP